MKLHVVVLFFLVIVVSSSISINADADADKPSNNNNRTNPSNSAKVDDEPIPKESVCQQRYYEKYGDSLKNLKSIYYFFIVLYASATFLGIGWIVWWKIDEKKRMGAKPPSPPIRASKFEISALKFKSFDQSSIVNIMPHYKLIYFDIIGLGEPIRLCFAQAGVPFEEERLKFEDWSQHKDKMPFGQVPVLEVDGKRLTQSMAILRYIARKHGLEADDEWDRALGDELATSWLDMFSRSAGARDEKDKAVKKQKYQTVLDEFIKPRLKIMDERLSRSKSGFIAGSKVTWCDFAVYGTMLMIRDYYKCPLNDYKNCQRLVATIEALPKVKEWQSKHPNLQFSVFPSPMD